MVNLTISNAHSIELERPETVWWNTRPGLTLNRTQLDWRAAMQSTEGATAYPQSDNHLRERIARTTHQDGNGCWIWDRRLDRDGYGRIGIAHRPYAAHRVSYVVFRAPIPDGMQVDHLCRVRACCNPEHLELVTTQENTRRGALARHACRRGHPRTPESTYVDPQGNRSCRVCRRSAHRRWKDTQAAK